MRRERCRRCQRGLASGQMKAGLSGVSEEERVAQRLEGSRRVLLAAGRLASAPADSPHIDRNSGSFLSRRQATKFAISDLFGRYLRTGVCTSRSNGTRLAAAATQNCGYVHRGGGRMAFLSTDPELRTKKKPHPTDQREVGRCTDLVSSTPEHRREGRWCLG